MPTRTIQIGVNEEAAEAYASESHEARAKIDLLLSLRLRELTDSEVSLAATMDAVADRAEALGLAADDLNSMLCDG